MVANLPPSCGWGGGGGVCGAALHDVVEAVVERGTHVLDGRCGTSSKCLCLWQRIRPGVAAPQQQPNVVLSQLRAKALKRDLQQLHHGVNSTLSTHLDLALGGAERGAEEGREHGLDARRKRRLYQHIPKVYVGAKGSCHQQCAGHCSLATHFHARHKQGLLRHRHTLVM